MNIILCRICELDEVKRLRGSKELDEVKRLPGSKELDEVKRLRGAEALDEVKRLRGAEQLDEVNMWIPLLGGKTSRFTGQVVLHYLAGCHAIRIKIIL